MSILMQTSDAVDSTTNGSFRSNDDNLAVGVLLKFQTAAGDSSCIFVPGGGLLV